MTKLTIKDAENNNGFSMEIPFIELLKVLFQTNKAKIQPKAYDNVMLALNWLHSDFNQDDIITIIENYEGIYNTNKNFQFNVPFKAQAPLDLLPSIQNGLMIIIQNYAFTFLNKDLASGKKPETRTKTIPTKEIFNTPYFFKHQLKVERTNDSMAIQDYPRDSFKYMLYVLSSFDWKASNMNKSELIQIPEESRTFEVNYAQMAKDMKINSKDYKLRTSNGLKGIQKITTAIALKDNETDILTIVSKTRLDNKGYVKKVIFSSEAIQVLLPQLNTYYNSGYQPFEVDAINKSNSHTLFMFNLLSARVNNRTYKTTIKLCAIDLGMKTDTASQRKNCKILIKNLLTKMQTDLTKSAIEHFTIDKKGNIFIQFTKYEKLKKVLK